MSATLNSVLVRGVELARTQKALTVVDELFDAHEASHRLYRCAADDDTRLGIEGDHDVIVSTLKSLGYDHPPAPTDFLDMVEEEAPVASVPTEKCDLTIEIPILKVDAERRIVYGVVLEPDVVDGQKEWESAGAIERAAHKFLKDYNKETELGVRHKAFGDVGAELIECYVAPQDLDFDGILTGEDVIRKGSWVMGVHITDDELWQDVKEGGITGFSIGGIATVRAT